MKQDGGAAFPFPYPGADGEKVIYGMTMRQWYKGQLCGTSAPRCIEELFEHEGDLEKQKVVLSHFAETIGLLAAAMLAEDAAREDKFVGQYCRVRCRFSRWRGVQPPRR